MSQTKPSLTSFKGLSFDCYGTLIDWMTPLTKDIHGLIGSQLPDSHPYVKEPEQAAVRFANIGWELEKAWPRMLKRENMALSIRSLAKELGVTLDEGGVEAFGKSTGTWPPFGDSIQGLQTLQKHYRLIILSNIDNASMGETLERQLGPVGFDAVYTAQDIGAYKPDLATFGYLKDHVRNDLGIDADRGELLHVACSLFADHVPAKQMGWPSVWIKREAAEGKGTEAALSEYEGRVAFGWEFVTLGEFADEVERAFELESVGRNK